MSVLQGLDISLEVRDAAFFGGFFMMITGFALCLLSFVVTVKDKEIELLTAKTEYAAALTELQEEDRQLVNLAAVEEPGLNGAPAWFVREYWRKSQGEFVHPVNKYKGRARLWVQAIISHWLMAGWVEDSSGNRTYRWKNKSAAARDLSPILERAITVRACPPNGFESVLSGGGGVE